MKNQQLARELFAGARCFATFINMLDHETAREVPSLDPQDLAMNTTEVGGRTEGGRAARRGVGAPQTCSVRLNWCWHAVQKNCCCPGSERTVVMSSATWRLRKQWGHGSV
jgi:hypothetical protein